MNLNGKRTEPSTVLEPARSCYNHCICTTLDSDSGAGANAGSRADMRFVGTDPLSELVWSPQKGLSLKCADGSLSKKKPCVLWCPEASNIVITSSTDKATDNTYLVTSPATLNISEGVRKEIPINLLTSSAGVMQLSRSSHERGAADDQVEKLEKITGPSFTPGKEGVGCDKEQDILGSHAVENNHTSIKQIITAGGRDDRNLMKKTEEDVLPSKNCCMEECEGFAGKLKPGTSTKNVHEVNHSLENESKIKSDPGPPGFHHLEKREPTSENDLRNSHSRKIIPVATNIVQSEWSGEVRINSPQGVVLVAEEGTPSGTDCPTSCGIQRHQMKGKCRDFSDGMPHGRMSHEGDNSYESVDSCNSAELNSAGKKQFHFEQSLIVGSKRLKRQIQDSPSSSSFIRQESSFRNWISNMMKGFSSSRESTVPSLALTLVDPDQGHKVPEQRPVGCDKKTGSAGFRTFFGSFYRAKRKAEETLASDQVEEYRRIEPDDKLPDVHTMPKTCNAETGSSYELFKLPNSKLNITAGENGVSKAFQARDSSKNISAAHHDIGSMGNISAINLAPERVKDRTISDSSSDKGAGGLGKKNDFELPFDGKANQAYSCKGDPMTSLWITRFTPKVPVPLPDQEACNQTNSEALIFPTDGMISECPASQFPSSNSNTDLQHGQNLAVVLPYAQTCGTSAGNSLGLSKEKVFLEEKSACQLDPSFPYPRIKHTEVMASVFARRLDALKHIVPSDATQDPFSEPRCQVDLGAWSVSESLPSKLQFKTGIDYGGRPSDGGDCHLQAGNAPVTSDGNDHRKGKDFNWMPNETVLGQHENVRLFNGGIPSSSLRRKSTASSLTPFCTLLDKPLSNVTQSFFDAVKRLQLSRADILKWMQSCMPLSRLDGFFLRLRLGKWEAGIDRTGYHVACITGVQEERLPRNPKCSIAVDVEGISCLVESQYISNQDFLEDELMAWWTSTSKEGGKIPSQEDLRLKFEEKKMLGF